eukprot:TRINITY_DN38283_c0_g1_i1.p1 TRINITY_DN38283_c0_g1~~TRINITY_DN38283_c0_g1_i1.p1  ORF type:complete len:470 (-),score=77.26 TRINITY_DN38283_c0_g1_i1:125-1534(-)
MVMFHDSMKISKTPFPFPYAQTCDTLLVMHWLVTPFVVSQWVNSMLWAFMFSFVQVMILWCLNGIAVEIENPFGLDVNDLDQQAMHHEMNESLLMLISPEANKTPRLVPDQFIMSHSSLEEQLQTGSSTFAAAWGCKQTVHPLLLRSPSGRILEDEDGATSTGTNALRRKTLKVLGSSSSGSSPATSPKNAERRAAHAAKVSQQRSFLEQWAQEDEDDRYSWSKEVPGQSDKPGSAPASEGSLQLPPPASADVSPPAPPGELPDAASTPSGLRGVAAASTAPKEFKVVSFSEDAEEYSTEGKRHASKARLHADGAPIPPVEAKASDAGAAAEQPLPHCPQAVNGHSLEPPVEEGLLDGKGEQCLTSSTASSEGPRTEVGAAGQERRSSTCSNGSITSLRLPPIDRGDAAVSTAWLSEGVAGTGVQPSAEEATALQPVHTDSGPMASKLGEAATVIQEKGDLAGGLLLLS